tara:strand:- start:3796 stop:4353 length:558 start_codon:yes stop_codon:yes gene_type:complete
MSFIDRTILDRIGNEEVELREAIGAIRDAIFDLDDAIAEVRDQGHSGEQQLSQFPALITGSTLITGADARWVYDFQQVSLTKTGKVEVLTETTRKGGILGDVVQGKAYNISESTNTPKPTTVTESWYVSGVDVHGASYRGTSFQPRPIGFSVFGDVVLMMAWSVGEHILYLFDRPNPHDGNCSGA